VAKASRRPYGEVLNLLPPKRPTKGLLKLKGKFDWGLDYEQIKKGPRVIAGDRAPGSTLPRVSKTRAAISLQGALEQNNISYPAPRLVEILSSPKNPLPIELFCSGPSSTRFKTWLLGAHSFS